MSRGGLWSSPDFLKLWTGQAISQMGSRISAQALPLAAVLTLSATPFQMGLLNGAGAAAILMFGLFAGAWVDRFRRRPILMLADLGRAVVLGSIPLATWFGRLTIGQLYLAAAASGLLTVFFDAGYQAYVPSLVDRKSLLGANAKLALTVSISDVAGTGVAGLLVQWITAPMAILFDALSFLASALSIWWIGTPETPAQTVDDPHIRREIVEGLREAWHNPVLRILTKRTGTGAVSAGFIGGLYMLFAIRELHLSPALLGGIIAVGGASNLFGALISERLVKRLGVERTLFLSALAAGAASLTVPLARGPVPVCAAILVAGQLFDMAWPIYTINELTLRQTVTPDRLLGRVNSAMHLLFYGLMPVGALAGGVLAESIGMRTTMMAGAVGFLLSSLWLVKLPAAMKKSELQTQK